MIRTQIQLTEEQTARLRELAAQRGVSLAELVRLGVDLYLKDACQVTDAEKRQRALSAAGRFHSGKTDISAKHDEYLAEAYEK